MVRRARLVALSLLAAGVIAAALVATPDRTTITASSTPPASLIPPLVIEATTSADQERRELRDIQVRRYLTAVAEWEAAEAARLAREAAERAAAEKAERDRRAAAARAAAASRGSSRTYTGNPAANRALGQQMAAERGWTGEQWACLDSLWGAHESGWNEYADNPDSTAYGIPQATPGRKMASHGADWQTNPRTQIAWGLDYIANREGYGSPCKALAFRKAKGYY